MKKITGLLLLLPALVFAQPENKGLVLKGQLQLKQSPEMIFVSYRLPDLTQFSDSATIRKGRFKLKLPVNEPVKAALTIRYRSADKNAEPQLEELDEICLEPGNIMIKAKDSLKFATISGSAAQEAYEAYQKLETPYNNRLEEIYNQYFAYTEQKDTANERKAMRAYEKTQDEKRDKVMVPYFKSNPSSPIALIIIGSHIGPVGIPRDLETLASLFQGLHPSLQQSVSGQILKKELETFRKTSVGAYAMDFTEKDTLGNPVSLSSFRGKYVLLDFWASWCGPCREENPYLVKAYNTYKEKGFTIVGVSLDKVKNAWLSAIRTDGLTWTHVCGLNYPDNEVVNMYGVKAVPQNFLLDPEGKIIARNLREEKLEEELEKLFKDK